MSDNGKGGNGGMKLDIGDLFEVRDLLMLIETLNFAATRTMMSDGPGNEAESERLRFLSEKLAELSPLPKGERNMGYSWFKAMSKAKDCAFYGAYLVEDSQGYGKSVFHMDIVCDDLVVRAVKKGKKDEIVEAIPAVVRYLRDSAPVEAEPLVGLNGLVDLGERVGIRRKGDLDWENKGRLDAVASAMSAILAPVSPFVYVIEASNFWAVQSVVETRFAVPVSAAAAVVEHVRGLNEDALAEYSKRYSSQDFNVSMTP